MLNYAVKRILMMIPLLLLVSLLMFGVMHLLPGNAVTMILSDLGTVEQKAQMEASLGLDQNFFVQYWNWLTSFIRGDMGNSFLTGQPVTQRMLERMPVTVEMILLSIVLAILIGVPVGILCAVRRNRMTDYIFSTVSMVGMAMPVFWMGMLFIMLFSVKLHWLPASGFVRFNVDPVNNLRTMVLPSVTLSLSLAAAIVRQTRSAMLDALNQDYILTARAKGAKENAVFWKHALRNALIPVVTAISMQINNMVGGAFVIETLFLLPGMGKSMVDAIYQRDYPIVMSGTMMVVFFIVVINLLVDIINAVIDPRISNSRNAAR